jgi:transcriptional regulator with XRE-family HTH domain
MKKTVKNKSFSESLRVSRLKELLKNEKLKQKDLADILDMEPQNVSRFIRLGKVSEKTCNKIIKAFPSYNLKWLLGYQDEPMKELSESEKLEIFFKESNSISNALGILIKHSLAKKSLKIDELSLTEDEIIYRIIDDKTKITLKEISARDMIKFQHALEDYLNLTVNHLLLN